MADGGFALWIHGERTGGKYEIMYRDKLSSRCYRYTGDSRFITVYSVPVSQKASLLIHHHSNPFNLIYWLVNLTNREKKNSQTLCFHLHTSMFRQSIRKQTNSGWRYLAWCWHCYWNVVPVEVSNVWLRWSWGESGFSEIFCVIGVLLRDFRMFPKI